VNLSTDDANCGSCGKACGATERCGNGACLPVACDGGMCQADQVCSAGACIDKACAGVVCGFGETCAMGQCTCDSKHALCGGHCADPQTDDVNCGACGNVCPAGQACGGGHCLARDCTGQPCDPGNVCFNQACTAQACVGVVCPASQTCINGACACAQGQVSCGGTCASLQTDSKNCGSCGNACPMDQRCGAGQCLAASCGGTSCGPTQVCVQNACVDAACVGVVCPSGASCAGGLCACPTGQTLCNGACVDLTSSDENCGVCGARCAAGQQCLSGSCGVTGCPSGKRVCGAACVDLQSDADNCAACGNACGGGRVCVAATCQCPAGLAYCGTSCVNLSTDIANCGACGHQCSGGTCNGVCSCPPGQSLCGDTCRNTQTDPLACGACGRPCATGQTCQNSTCVCGNGYALCGGACIPVANDSANCGGCNIVCNANSACVNGACQPAVSCFSSFNTEPTDCAAFPLDTSKCGVFTAVGNPVPLTGSANNSMALITQTIPQASPNERIEMRGSWTSGTYGCGTHYFMLDGPTGNPVATLPTSASSGTLPVSVIAPGSVYTCAQVAEGAVEPSGCNAMSFAVDLQRYQYSGRYNTGGTSAATADTLLVNGVTNRTCDQICGALMNVCGDNREFHRVTLGPGQSAYVEGVFVSQAAAATFNLQAMDLSGGLICNMLADAGVSPTPTSYKARIVNNTMQTKVVHLVPNALTGDVQWNMAVGVESADGGP
jgi:hypothetical protein